MSKKMPQAFVDRDGYSTVPSSMADWLSDRSLLPRKSVPQMLAEIEARQDRDAHRAPTKRRAR